MASYAMPSTPKIGDRMPAFELPSADGTVVRSEDLLGRGPIVLFFYPKDETPGCTAEACAFRDEYEEFLSAGAIVVGVSPDSAERHQAFAQRHRLPFLLLADPDKRVFALYGVKNFLGLVPGRETFVIDRAGIVRHHVRTSLQPVRHVREALAAVRADSRPG
jgi:thioredoxin-dependent peroxiredoxin